LIRSFHARQSPDDFVKSPNPVTPANAGFDREKLDYFKKLIQPIVATLHQLGIPAEMTKTNNIMVAAKKISGNSQYTNTNRMLSHGTLLFDSDLQALANSLDTTLGLEVWAVSGFYRQASF
jgi:lipoate-protein ligase A